MPRAADLPEIHSKLIEVLATTNPIGVKGAGEAGATGAPAAVINAIADALRGFNTGGIEMPATPQRVWASLQHANKIVHR
jgi:carbon-monoxide dehydrogenase large subunit